MKLATCVGDSLEIVVALAITGSASVFARFGSTTADLGDDSTRDRAKDRPGAAAAASLARSIGPIVPSAHDPASSPSTGLVA